MFKRCKVVMLPTNKKVVYGQLCLNNSYLPNLTQPLVIGYDSPHLTPQHLYILSDDKKNFGDFVITPHLLNRGIDIYNTVISKIDIPGSEYFCKKIIATTDSYLIEGDQSWNLPCPSKSFIDKYVEEYNKGNKIEDIIVEYEEKYDGDCLSDDDCDADGYDPEYFPKINPKDNTITIRKIKDSWNRVELMSIIREVIKLTKRDATHQEYEDLINNF